MKKIYTLIVSLFMLTNSFAQTQYGWDQKTSIPASGRHRSTAL